MVMGDPRRLRNKYNRPKHLWDKQRLTEEKRLKKEYGLKNMKELWVALEELKKYRREARRLLSLSEEERKSDVIKILTKLQRLRMLKEKAELDDVLSLGQREILERRLQTIVYRKGLASTISQSRQLITHGFILVNGIKVSAPSYIVEGNEEETIKYSKPIDIQIKEKVRNGASEGKKENKTSEKEHGG